MAKKPTKKSGMFTGAGPARDKRIKDALTKGKEGGGSTRRKKKK